MRKKTNEITHEITKPVNLATGLTIARSMRFAEGFAKTLMSPPPHRFVFTKLKLLVPIGAVLVAQNIARNLKLIPQVPLNEKINAVSTIISNVGTIGLCARIFSEGLVNIRLLPASIIPKTIPMVGFSAICEAVGVCLEVKLFAETYLFAKKFAKQVDLKDAQAFIKESAQQEYNFTAKYFQMDERALTARLQTIEKEASASFGSNDRKQIGQGIKSLHSTMAALKDRFSTKLRAHALKIAANAAGVAGIVLLIFTSVAAPIGFGTLLFGSLGNLALTAYQNRADRQFKAVLASI